MKILDVLVDVAGELEELLRGAGRLLLGRLHTLGLAAALDPQELVDGVGLGRPLGGAGFSLKMS